MIRITTDLDEKFDLYEDFSISVEENSVMTGKRGSFSLPIDLPWTDNNVRIIGYPSRVDRKQPFTLKRQVTISAGVWIRRATLNVESAQENKNISCELYFGESRFYQAIADVTLPRIFDSVIRDDYHTFADVNAKITAWLNHFEKVQTGEKTDDFFLFPVCATREKREEKIEETLDYTNFSLHAIYERYVILNRPDVPTGIKPLKVNETSYNGQYGGQTAVSASGKMYYKLAAHKKWTVPTLPESDSEMIVYQRGYGVTPFLKFNVILKRLFEYFGYQLVDSEFQTNTAFTSLCYINNTADAIMDGKIHYAQLVPDKKVSDFLEHVENSFGVEFIFNEINNTVTPRFWKDLITEKPQNDLDDVFEDFPNITYSDSTAIKLSTGKSAIEEEIPYATFNALFSKYKKKPTGLIPPDLLFFEFNKVNLLYFCYAFRKIFIMGSWTEVPVVMEKIPAVLDYHDPADAVEEKNCGFESIPQIKVSLDEMSPIMATAKLLHSFYPPDKAVSQTATQPEDSVSAYIPFINSIRHLKTVKVGIDANQNTSEETKEKESGSLMEIYPCFFHGFAGAKADMPNIEKTFFGSQYRYNNTGGVRLQFDLSTIGLYETFWKDYDRVIRHSFHDLSGRAHLALSRMMAFEKHNPYLIHGQSVLLNNIKYEITHKGIHIVELNLKTLKKYEE